MKRLVLAAAVALSLLAGFATTASAGAPVAVQIRLHPAVFFPVQTGTWDASGGIDDAGTYVRTDVHSTGSLPDCFCPLEHNGAFQEEFLLTGSQGTLTLKDETLVTPMEEPSPFGDVRVVWQITSGTGDYERTSGHGKGFFGPPLTLYLDGVVSKVGD
jgi:hypothetical protein